MTNVKRAGIVVTLLPLLMTVVNIPASAQGVGDSPDLYGVDLSGIWAPIRHEDVEVDRAGGPPPGDYTGLPINDANRMRADTYTNAIVALPQWQCRPHPTGYENMGPDVQQFEKVIDPISREIIAWRIICHFCYVDRWIWMDGRPRPPEEALHTWEGFTTGEWDGNTLIATATHLKETYTRRNGLSMGPRAIVTEYITRHGDYLDWSAVIDDPDYLSEPLIRNQTYLRIAGQTPPRWGCTAQAEEEWPRGFVPHYLPGQNPFLTEFATQRVVPFEASRGGAETMYPEYQLKLRNMAMSAPAASVVNGLYKPVYDKSSAPQPKNDAATNLNAEIRVVPVRKNIYLLVGAGGNITVSVGPTGVLLVDTGNGRATDKVLAAIRQLARQRADRSPAIDYVRPDEPSDPGEPPAPMIRFIINTSIDADHRGGNQRISESPMFRPLVNAMKIIGHQTHLDRTIELAATEQPTDTFSTKYLKLQPYFNGDAIQIIHIPAAHTDGDSVVWFRNADVISTGHLFGDDYPVIDLEKGGSIQGVIDGLNDLMDLAFPGYMSQDGTLLVPAHGRIGDFSDLAYYQEMTTIIRDRIQDMIKRGMTLDAVKAAKPTFDFDPVYGRSPGAPDRFVEQVYRSLTQNR